MKRKILVTLLALVVAVCSLGLFACGGDDKVEGTYKFYSMTTTQGSDSQTVTANDPGYSENYMVIELKVDKTVAYSAMGMNMSGTWEKDGDNYVITISNLPATVSIKKGEMVMESTQGEKTIRYVLKKVTTTDNDESGDVSLSDYFVFSNVTVNSTMTQTIVMNSAPSNPMVTEIEETFKTNDDKWLYVQHDANKVTTDGVAYSYYDLEVLFDGTDTYVSKYDSIQSEYVENVKTEDESYKNRGEYFLIYVNMLPMCESEFAETSTGVYTADEFSLSGIYDVSNASITVVDGKLSSVAFTLTMQEDSSTMTQEFTYTFSNWGTTVVE